MIAETTFAPSKTPYAIRWDRFRIDERGQVSLPAIWVKRRNGLTIVCQGTLWGYGYDGVEAFRQRFDARYGGDCHARWDGEHLWAPGLAAFAYPEKAGQLDEVLRNLPNVPDGYDGWYRINAR